MLQFHSLFILTYNPTSLSVRNGVENLLKHYIPEVKGIEEVGQVGKDIKEGKVVLQSGGTFDT
jgi:hypothetical protein